jgi:hypothetical protein
MHQDHGTLAEALGNGSHLSLPSGLRTTVDFFTDGYYHLTWIIGLPALLILFRRWRRDRRFGPHRAVIAITLLGLQLIPIASWGNPRFHTPMLPFFALMTAVSIDWLITHLRPREPLATTDEAGGNDLPTDSTDQVVGAVL